jgi:epoxyqueuosine reductase
MSDFEEWVVSEIRRLVLKDEENRMTGVDNSPFFDEPLVGFTSGEDPIFRELKGIIGDFHLTPEEVMTSHCEKIGIDPPKANEIGVISFVLPISEATRRENASMKAGPSERWSHTRLFGERFNKSLQRHLVSLLEDNGHLAVAPEQTENFKIVEDERVGKASSWSQRHVAFACGLGTFGLSDGLITARGKAHRIGSVVVDMPLESPGRGEDIHAGCIYFQNDGCKVCAKRCPVDAISEDGHDKVKCSEFVFGQADMIMERYGIDIYGCGLCQTGVPCEHIDPVKEGETDP